ncbi:MAG: glycosyltransferase involved in cell wall biosynthesis [Parasphingorhabdus sp.]|jgi:glycosyltransferase involved in cell wall biosynthesis|uniref:glycosyltransferase family 2 protein n=1 Tax=Parasphingorhabdus sp. TaxID=2709688 RepID=UPI0039E609C3|tara:strand:- start:624 stop:1520 length:897 start_codon:yes stop_codon:yes gene_type:complete
MTMRVSTLVLTLNEEANLPACLDALSWCDDVVVVDSGSTDRTVEIAKAHGARVLIRAFDNFAGQRNWGVANSDFKHEWVLHLDADEVVTPEFRAALEACEAPAGIDAYQVPSKTMFFGRWLKYAGMWPSYQVRLGKRDTLRFVQIGHGQREDLPDEKVGVFPEAYLHFSFSHGLAQWLRRHLRYAEEEVEQLAKSRQGSGIQEGRGGGVTQARRRLKAIAARLPLTLRPFLKFLYVYVARLGFLDGRRGFAYAFMLSVYEGMIAVIAFGELGKVAPPQTNVAQTPAQAGISKELVKDD